MGRKRRSHLPGAVFHLTARTQGHEPWFTPVLRDRVVDYTAAAIRRSDARLLAFAIMPNHLHLVLRQGQSRLGRVMQPLLRRVAALVQRSHGVEGHVFERRFGDHACLDPDYVRNALVYAHLNPVRGGLVDDPCAYRWSSHRYYVEPGGLSEPLASTLRVDEALRLFAPRKGLEIRLLGEAYTQFVTWRMAFESYKAAAAGGDAVAVRPIPPPVLGGDIAWTQDFAPLFRGVPGPGACNELSGGAPPPDMGEIASRTLAEIAPNVSLDLVRSGSKVRAAVRAPPGDHSSADHCRPFGRGDREIPAGKRSVCLPGGPF